MKGPKFCSAALPGGLVKPGSSTFASFCGLLRLKEMIGNTIFLINEAFTFLHD